MQLFLIAAPPHEHAPTQTTMDVRPAPLPPSLRAPALTLADLEGVRTSGVRAGIKPSGRTDVGLIVFDKPTAVAGIFTQNKFAAAPVKVSIAHLAQSGGMVRAIVVNSGNANACTGEQGLTDARRMCRRVASHLGCNADEVLVCSTGVIGQPLPMDKVLSGIDAAFAALASGPAAGALFLDAIQTTDAYPKAASTETTDQVRVAGVCKGAGMIHPNMATMLAFCGVDAAATPESLQATLRNIAARSFNAVHVDTHASTNDTFLLFATGARSRGNAEAVHGALAQVAQRLSWLIARDGEGATAVTTVSVTGARDDAAARRIADLVVSSALVRTALYGKDPNWGRFVSQVGNSPDLGDASKVSCSIQGTVVFERGEPLPFDGMALRKAMTTEDIALDISLGDGHGAAVIYTSDLGYRYIEVNAEYTT